MGGDVADDGLHVIGLLTPQGGNVQMSSEERGRCDQVQLNLEEAILRIY